MNEYAVRAREDYNRVAEHYVKTVSVFSEEIMYPRIIALAEKHDGPLAGKSILDLGCGAGLLVKRLKDFGAGSVVGIDISTKMLDIGGEMKIGNLVGASMDTLPF